MLSFKYISSQGTEYDLLTNNRFITECEAFDYGYEAVTFSKRYGAKVYGFEMPMKEFEAECYVFGENRKEQINELFAAFDYDVANMQPGTIVCNGYSIPAYSPSVSDTSVNTNNVLWDTFNRQFICPYPFWSKQTQFILFEDSGIVPEFENIKDYLPVSENGKADYEWDLMTNPGKQTSFVNTDLIGSEWVLTINGAVDGPVIHIGDKIIELNVNIGESEYVTIDSRTKTIILHRSGGSEENVFGYRDVSVDIFTKIPRGTIEVWWEGDFTFTLALYDERTAPLWN